MSDKASNKDKRGPASIRWWPAVVIVIAATIAVAWVRAHDAWHFQRRNLFTIQIVVPALALLAIWWTFLSRASKKLRLTVTFSLLGLFVLAPALFRIRGVSGDLLPILEWRWTSRNLPMATEANAPAVAEESTHATNGVVYFDFPQFLGSDRDGKLSGPNLETNWTEHPPVIVWRHDIGAGWSGFSIVGNRAFTQEQRGENECVTCYDLFTGNELWLHSYPARYNTTIAGEGPRATPTVSSNRVFTLGATGILNCLDARTGALVWTHDIVKDADSTPLDWGFAGSPLVFDGKVVVSAGGTANKSLLAYAVDDGRLVWAGGSAMAQYSSPLLTTLAGVRQIISFNDGFVSSQEPDTGKVLWEYPWGNGNQHIAMPIVVGTNRVVVTAGYGAGCEELEIEQTAKGVLKAHRVWKTVRMKAKFANPVARDGFLYGLDDGILACVDLTDGSQRWKEGRYGHGQGLLIGELYLLMSESGELVLLHPTPDAPNELARFGVFDRKTWNTIALSGDLLLVRNDKEAACLRLKLAE